MGLHRYGSGQEAELHGHGSGQETGLLGHASGKGGGAPWTWTWMEGGALCTWWRMGGRDLCTRKGWEVESRISPIIQEYVYEMGLAWTGEAGLCVHDRWLEAEFGVHSHELRAGLFGRSH